MKKLDRGDRLRLKLLLLFLGPVFLWTGGLGCDRLMAGLPTSPAWFAITLSIVGLSMVSWIALIGEE
jgi:hypothetical protein